MLKIEDEKKKELMVLIEGGLSTKSIILILDSEIDYLEKKRFSLADIALMMIKTLKLDLKVTSLTKSMNVSRTSEATDLQIYGDYEEEASEYFIKDKKDGFYSFHFDIGEGDA